MTQYLALLRNILDYGVVRSDRTGTGTKGIFGAQLRFDLSGGFPLVTTRKVFYKVPYLDFETVGDSKIIWELNRHQHLVTLAKAWLLTREERYVRELSDQWNSWVKANPYPLGINWASTLEIAFRSLSWIWIDRLLSGSPRFAEWHPGLLSTLAFHGRYIERYLSTYFSPNTHLLGEAMAMFALGALYPQMPHSARWRKTGWEIVVREAGRQVHPDGVYFEQSLYYHVYALDLFLYARILAAANGIQVPTAYDEVLGKMLNVIASLAQAGLAEGFGDDDGGRLFNPRRNQTEHMTDPLAIGALVYGRHEPEARLTEESIWLFGERAVAELPPKARQGAGDSAATSEMRSTACPDGGLYILADSAPCRQTMMVDAGPHGGGSCGHGHADALSLRLTIDSARWLVDSGSGVYISSNPADRNVFRGTAAHNTVRVDGLDQTEADGPFSWKQLPTSTAESWLVGKTFTYFCGIHDGYKRLLAPVIHRRSVLRVNDGGDGGGGVWLVRDALLGEGEHDLELSWHFASNVIVREADTGQLIAQVITENDTQANQPTLRLVRLDNPVWQTDLSQSMLSPAYGRYEPAPVIRSKTRAKLPAETATALLVEMGAPQNHSRARMIAQSDDNAQVFDLVVGERKHSFIFARNRQAWSVTPWSSDARLLYCGMENDILIHLIAIGASSVEWQGRELFHADRPSSYFEWCKRDGILRADPSPVSITSYFDELAEEPIASSSSSNNVPGAPTVPSSCAEND